MGQFLEIVTVNYDLDGGLRWEDLKGKKKENMENHPLHVRDWNLNYFFVIGLLSVDFEDGADSSSEILVHGYVNSG